MKIWITGIGGFLGSHLANALIADGHEVWGNDNGICSDMAHSKWSKADCCNFNLMSDVLKAYKPEVLIHCAATAHEGLSNFSPSFITRNIYEASVSTFSAAIAAGVKRIVFMSSMARYGHGHRYCMPPFKEDMPPAPIDPYGIAKVAAEKTLEALSKVHDFKYSILVPHNIIGIGQRHVDPYRNVAAIMINRCKQGNSPIVYGDGNQKRCFSPVADCIPSIIKAVHGAADGQVVNIGPDAGEITINDLAWKIIDITGFEGIPLHMDSRPNEVKEAYCSSDKARALLGYKEQQSLDDCLKQMAAYINPEPFVYDFPLEIASDKMPRTWAERLM